MRSLCTEIELLKKQLKRRGLGLRPMAPICMTIGHHCSYWDHRSKEPFLEDFFESTDHPRQVKGMPAVLSCGCPYDDQPVTIYFNDIRKCKLRERCPWFNSSVELAKDLLPMWVYVDQVDQSDSQV